MVILSFSTFSGTATNEVFKNVRCFTSEASPMIAVQRKIFKTWIFLHFTLSFMTTVTFTATRKI